MKITTTLVWTSLLVCSLAPSVTAQTITAPAVGTRLRAGDDFATKSLGDPGDMSNREDVSLNPIDHGPGWQSISGIGSGVWAGTTASDAYVMVYSPGLDSPAIPTERNGRLVPIPTATYRKIVFKATMSAVETIGMHWFFSHAGDIANAGVDFFPQQPAGTRVYSLDLDNTSTGGMPWVNATFSNVRGFRIDPNEGNTAGMAFQLDWVRLTRADADPQAVQTTISWGSGSGANDITVDVIDAGNVVVQTVDTNQTAASDSVTWFYGGLPAGAYTIRVYHAASGPGSAATRSVTINATPTILITSPDATGGSDYATVVRSNPWDFSSGADVKRTESINGITFDTAMHGTSAAAAPPTADPQVWLLEHVSGPVESIDASKYHRLTFRLKFDRTDGGWSTTRLIFGSTAGRPDLMTATEDITVWLEGGSAPYRSYTLDLATLTSGNGLVPGGTGPATWAGFLNQVRFDPSEFPEASTFHLDDIKLAADDRSTSGSYTIAWTSTSDSTGPAATVSLAFATDINGTGLTNIVSGEAASAGQYVWATSGVPNGTYFVRAVISDGTDSLTTWSSGPIVIANQPFTDAVLTAGVSIVRAVHITELRARIDALRARFVLGAYPYVVDPTLVPGTTVIKAQHVVDLRTALSQVYVAAGLSAPPYVDPTLVSGMLVKVAHIAELRSAVIAIE